KVEAVEPAGPPPMTITSADEDCGNEDIGGNSFDWGEPVCDCSCLNKTCPNNFLERNRRRAVRSGPRTRRIPRRRHSRTRTAAKTQPRPVAPIAAREHVGYSSSVVGNGNSSHRDSGWTTLVWSVR